MKQLLKITTLLFITCILQLITYGQDCNKCISANDAVTFLGIDYSMLSFEGTLEESDQNKVINSYYPSWNSLFATETKKYDLEKSFGLKNITLTTDYFDNYNKKSKNINNTRKQAITDQDVQKHIQQLKISNINTPYALFLVAISYNKTKESATHYLVLWDVKSKKIIGLQQFETKPGGFGFRNYWAASFYNILKKENKKVKQWIK